MRIDKLILKQYRNYEFQEVSFLPGTNVLIGENAQGKTNALEAIYLLAVGKSHRALRDSELMMWGCHEAIVEGTVIVNDKQQNLKLSYRSGGKKAQINGVDMSKMTQFLGHFQVVLFAPEDLQLVKAGPAIRRKFLDVGLGQIQPKYLFHLSQYMKTLQHRNAILKQATVDWESIEAFDEQLIVHGAEVISRRLKHLNYIQEYATKIYEIISDGREDLKIDYVCSLHGLKQRTITVGNLADEFQQVLQLKRNADAHSGNTSVGPHRDDISFSLTGHPVQSFASQGQLRSIALALRLAEVDLFRQELGDYPVLLLDDVMSELDEGRQKNLLLSTSEKVQTIITTTNIFQLSESLRSTSGLFPVASGIIESGGD